MTIFFRRLIFAQIHFSIIKSSIIKFSNNGNDKASTNKSKYIFKIDYTITILPIHLSPYLSLKSPMIDKRLMTNQTLVSAI